MLDDCRKIVVLNECGDVCLRVTPHVLFGSLDKFRVKSLFFQDLVAEPHYFSQMYVSLYLRSFVEVRHLVDAHQIEADGIRHNVLSVHCLALRFRIVFPVERIIFSEIFVYGDSYRAVADNYALVEGANLHVYPWNHNFRINLLQVRECLIELVVQIVNVSILRFCITYKCLKCRVLIESQEYLVYLGIVYFAQLEHILNECSCLHRIVGVHLLKGRKVARGEVLAFQSVVAADFNFLRFAIQEFESLELIFA